MVTPHADANVGYLNSAQPSFEMTVQRCGVACLSLVNSLGFGTMARHLRPPGSYA